MPSWASRTSWRAASRPTTRRLEAHLRRYTARNTFDYFIHKDLGAFLRRELDFYIKNEVMHLDDVENESTPRVEQYLSKIKVIRRIAGKIIDFLAQVENFQKKLWLKKKFVVEAHLLRHTRPHIPEEFYPEIVANEAPARGVDHGSLRLTRSRATMQTGLATTHSEPLNPEFLKGQSDAGGGHAVLRFGFHRRLLEAVGDVEEQSSLDGVLFHSENLHALNLMHGPVSGRSL